MPHNNRIIVGLSILRVSHKSIEIVLLKSPSTILRLNRIRFWLDPVADQRRQKVLHHQKVYLLVPSIRSLNTNDTVVRGKVHRLE